MLNKLQRNMAFMEDWNLKGEENWKKNQEIKRKREEEELRFKIKQEEKTKNKLQKMQELTKKEVLEGITQFKANLKKMGIQRDSSDSDGSDFQKCKFPFEINYFHFIKLININTLQYTRKGIKKKL